ncbi:MAG: Ig-like domain-containing protein [Prevotellaceae bacterium]|jgi:uncharacterized protein YjdB|nr:Ig-like domain-containing protein [Prevotellaceae bacterium]
MKRKINFLKNMAASLIMMSAAVFTSCSKNDEIIAVTDIRVEPSELTLVTGETKTLAVTLLPQNATGKAAVIWASNATNVATVDPITGEVEAVGEGVAVIVAGLAGVQDKTASCIVRVVAPEAPVESVTVEPATLELLVGAKQTLTATVLPNNATYKTVTWSSSNTDVATVDENTGEVTAVAVGSVTITAASGGESATCILTVNPVPVDNITLEPDGFELEIDATRTPNVTIEPANATYQTVTWTSSATNVATVDENTGEITGIAEGEAVITATADGKSATCTVTVIPRNDIFMTVKPGSGSEVKIYAVAQSLVVNWGDGNSITYSNCTEISHTYADGSINYNIKIMAQGLTSFGDVVYNNNITSDYVSTRMKGEVSAASFNNCPDLTVLAITNNKLTGIELKECPALLYLNCVINQITSLNLSSVPALEYLFFRSNQLSTVNLSGLSALNKMNLSTNLLTSLDMSDCTSLVNLDCSYNKLTSLNLNSACKTTLTDLDCSYNELTSLDVSGFTALTYFTCRNNKLITLDIRDCTGLKGTTYCLFNQLETVNVLGAKLEKLRLIDNKLTAAELNRIFNDLQDRTGISSGVLWIGTNPGTDDCDKYIATNKNWDFW